MNVMTTLLVALAMTLGAKENADTKVTEFSLEDFRGKRHALADYAQSKAIVLVFLGTECPLAHIYAPRLNELSKKWAERGVQFLGINSNRQDSLTEIAAYAQRHSIAFPLLKDAGNGLADTVGAQRTPEVFLLDQNRIVRYSGRIDDQFGVGYQRPEPTRKDLDLAIEQILDGKPVEVAKSETQGCIIGRVKAPNPSASSDVTYHNQITRIFQKRCIECHHEGEVAPFALTRYDESVGWAEMIREVVSNRRMPPWLASPEHGHFNNNPSLTEEEKNQIYTWIDSGCPEGDPKDAPEPIHFAKGWAISQPDDVFYMSDKPFTVPAEGVINYQYYEVDPGFKEDHWIKEAEVRAGSPGVVHHVIVFIKRPGGQRFGNPQMAYAPGMPPRKFPSGHAIKLPAGCKLIFQVHYTANGIEQADRSYVGFKYAKPEEVTHEVIGGGAGVMAFVIPPHHPNYKMVAWEKMREDTVLIGMNPHMHVRGKAFRYELVHPDGKTEILLDVPRYDFNWQLWYNLVEPKIMPKGSTLRCTAHFDNSTENLSNPDPTQKVTWGEQTWDEMMFGFYSTVEPVKKPGAKESAGGGQ